MWEEEVGLSAHSTRFFSAGPWLLALVVALVVVVAGTMVNFLLAEIPVSVVLTMVPTTTTTTKTTAISERRAEKGVRKCQKEKSSYYRQEREKEGKEESGDRSQE